MLSSFNVIIAVAMRFDPCSRNHHQATHVGNEFEVRVMITTLIVIESQASLCRSV